VILYEMLTGKLPFEARTPMEFIQHHVTKPPISLDVRVPGKTFPPGLAVVIGKALEKRPEDRYTTAADFADAMKPYAPGGGKGFSGLFPASSLVALEQSARQHAEIANMPEKGPESQRNPPISSRGGAHAQAQHDAAPRSQRGAGAAQMNGEAPRSLQQPVASSPKPLPAPHSVRAPMRSSGNEAAPQSMRNAPMSVRTQDAAAQAQKSPSTLTLIAVAVGFLLVGVVLAVVVLKLIR
jgi:serine/threonine-protein kinase